VYSKALGTEIDLDLVCESIREGNLAKEMRALIIGTIALIDSAYSANKDPEIPAKAVVVPIKTYSNILDCMDSLQEALSS
jgi:hypothetical protein